MHVRNATPDFMTTANAFETDVGHFWGLLHTRDYMRARSALTRLLTELNTLDSVREAYDHMMDLMKLSRSDNLGMRRLAPTIMLRLDRDQECYDFIKWWATCDPDGHYDWGDMSLPYLSINDADVLEKPDHLSEDEYPSFDHLVAILLLKLKLLVDIRNLKVARKIFLHKNLIQDLHESIELYVVRSPLSRLFQKLSNGDLVRTETKLRMHVTTLGVKIMEKNTHFMFHLFEPDEALSEHPEYSSDGSWEESVLAVQQSYAAFWEMQGVLELLDEARACGARDSEEEIEGMMKGPVFLSDPIGRNRTPEEFLAAVSVNRSFGYIDDAIANASYLGPWSERPSEQEFHKNREACSDSDADTTDDDDYDEGNEFNNEDEE
ncbi:hypothetical protein LTR56_024867 [Elasticomyces elasticus]|nr:hypothetical protein LTR56_024867 [Elasticomyces elasticus]KAK3623722.1 hypothetical protein LTR22_024274 [Elasticomyces elasticus]KAK4924835.1 hypothetical protein LTR49_008056 [Elasticomyces elasticus]KAK5743061.1 hypothetical protein LTS12_023980 [Elasticomyces elasticus]